MPSRGGLRIGGTRVHDPFGVDHRMTTGPRQALYVSDLERTLLRSDRLVLLRDRRVSGPSNLQGSIGANSRAMNCHGRPSTQVQKALIAIKKGNAP